MDSAAAHHGRSAATTGLTKRCSGPARDRTEWLRLLNGLYPDTTDADHVQAVDAYLWGHATEELVKESTLKRLARILSLVVAVAFVFGGTPRIFTIMHTTEDTLDKLDAIAVARGVHVVEKALRQLDATWASSSAVEALPAGGLFNEGLHLTPRFARRR